MHGPGRLPAVFTRQQVPIRDLGRQDSGRTPGNTGSERMGYNYEVTINDIRNAIEFLKRSFPGRGDEQRLVDTIEALERELARRKKK